MIIKTEKDENLEMRLKNAQSRKDESEFIILGDGSSSHWPYLHGSDQNKRHGMTDDQACKKAETKGFYQDLVTRFDIDKGQDIDYGSYPNGGGTHYNTDHIYYIRKSDLKDKEKTSKHLEELKAKKVLLDQELSTVQKYILEREEWLKEC